MLHRSLFFVHYALDISYLSFKDFL